MFDPKAIERIKALQRAWEADELRAFLERQPESRAAWRTGSGLPVERVYTPADVAGTGFDEIGLPGRYPFTRGPYPTMYRGRVWTMRQIAGFGTGEDTNQRFKYLIAQGQTGLSVDFDMPTLMGYDSDHPMSEGEVGREGVAIDTVADMEALFDQVDLEKISVSLTINPSAWILLAMYVVLAEKRGFDLNKLSGTIQADILKEYMAQKEYVFPIDPSVRIVRDCITWCARNMKRYNPINISGYHISEAGSSPLHEVAFTLCNLITYVEEVTKTGMHVDEFAPRLAFFFVCQTAAASLTRPQYKINVVRTAFQALSAVLGGAQSLHTNGMDEAFAIPTEEAMKIALRTQQIIAEETNAANVVDPLGGSYFLESLTNDYEKKIVEIIDEVDKLGGTIRLIQESWFQKHFADYYYDTAIKKQTGEKAVIGVNKYVEPDEKFDVEIHPHDETTAERQINRLRRIRKERDNAKVSALLEQLVKVAKDRSQNIMPVTIDLVREGASMGDIVEKLKKLWGTYRE